MPKIEITFIPSRESGVELQLIIAAPALDGPHPTIIFNHGSTGRGDDPSLYSKTWSPLHVQKYFTESGWMVVFPQRRGRGKSGGKYREGLGDDKKGYSSDISIALAGFERAVEDIDAVMDYLLTRTDVRVNKLVIEGASRGGILSIAYAGMRPSHFVGAINFNGGWLGRACSTYESVNSMIFERGAAFKRPTLWLHGSYDQYYRISHCRENFQKFIAAGGSGSFVATKGGHMLLPKQNLWRRVVDDYMDQKALAI